MKERRKIRTLINSFRATGYSHPLFTHLRFSLVSSPASREKKLPIKALLEFPYKLIAKGSVVNILKPQIKEP